MEEFKEPQATLTEPEIAQQADELNVNFRGILPELTNKYPVPEKIDILSGIMSAKVFGVGEEFVKIIDYNTEKLRDALGYDGYMLSVISPRSESQPEKAEEAFWARGVIDKEGTKHNDSTVLYQRREGGKVQVDSADNLATVGSIKAMLSALETAVSAQAFSQPTA